MSNRILITGVSGLLGNNLAFCFREDYQVIGQYFSHPVAIPGVETFYINLLNYSETRAFLLEKHPNVVIHCASRTDVDGIEEDKEGGWQANVLTTRILLDALRDLDAKFIHISTDSVYSGVEGPFDEDMETIPCNWYGKTKLESEEIVARRFESLILRTNLYGWNIQDKMSLAEWFLDGLQNSRQLPGFVDVQFSSIYTMLLAEIIEKCIMRNLVGIYNCACRNAWTKYEFGCKVAEIFDLDKEKILPSNLEKVGLRARRGKDLRLDTTLLENTLGERLPTMSQSLDRLHKDWQKEIPRDIKKHVGGELWFFYPERSIISYGGQAIDQADIDAVVNVLKSSNLTQGEEVYHFEKEIASYVGAQFAVAVSSGTAALHLACLAAGIGDGDDGITSPITFLASANAMVYCGAIPRFADIDSRTYNMDAKKLERCITKKTRVVIPVHFAGQSCAMKEIREAVSKKEKVFGHKIFIIEDASHALGSLYAGQRVGCCKYSDCAVFSFHPVKHITTGEGGIVVTNSRQLADRIRKLRSHGIEKDPEGFVNRHLAFGKENSETATGDSENPWYYEQIELGFNYRITDIQCALGRSQLRKLSWFRERRRAIVEKYNKAFAPVQHLTTPFEASDCESNFHLYVVKIDFDVLGISRSELINQLKTKCIQTQVHYIPVCLQPYYQNQFETGTVNCPEAEKYYSQCLSLPLFPAMKDRDVEKVIYEIENIIEVEK